MRKTKDPAEPATGSYPVATIQPLAGVLRVHPQGGSYQDHAGYDWAASVAFEADETARIYGATRAPTPSQWRAIRAELHRLGIARAVWDRYTARGHHVVNKQVEPDG